MAKVIFKYPNVIVRDFAYYYYLSDLYQGRLKEISRTAQAGFNSSDFNEMFFLCLHTKNKKDCKCHKQNIHNPRYDNGESIGSPLFRLIYLIKV